MCGLIYVYADTLVDGGGVGVIFGGRDDIYQGNETPVGRVPDLAAGFLVKSKFGWGTLESGLLTMNAGRRKFIEQNIEFPLSFSCVPGLLRHSTALPAFPLLLFPPPLSLHPLLFPPFSCFSLHLTHLAH